MVLVYYALDDSQNMFRVAFKAKKSSQCDATKDNTLDPFKDGGDLPKSQLFTGYVGPKGE